MKKFSKPNFKFSSNWKSFYKWFEKEKLNKGGSTWNEQRSMIQRLFEKTVPNRIDWSRLWKDQTLWYDMVFSKKREVLFSEQRRQIETLLLNQINELHSKIWIVVCKNTNGIPSVCTEPMTYDKAMDCKRELAGDENGIGGYKHIDQATVVNLNSLF